MLMEISYAQSGPIFPFPAESKSDKECVYRTMNTSNYFMKKLAMASDIDPPQFSRFISCVDWHVQLFNLSKEDNNGNGISLRMIKKRKYLFSNGKYYMVQAFLEETISGLWTILFLLLNIQNDLLWIWWGRLNTLMDTEMEVKKKRERRITCWCLSGIRNMYCLLCT